MGIELKGRIFSRENLSGSSRLKYAEKDNIQKMLKLECKLHAQIEMSKDCSVESCT